MSERPLITTAPHDEIVHVIVQRATLDEQAALALELSVARAAQESPRAPVVIDMAKVRFMPSVALGALVTLRKGFHLEGRRLILVGLQRQVRQVIEVTGLDRLIGLFGTVEDALDDLRSNA